MSDRRPDIWLPAYALSTLRRMAGGWRRRNSLTHVIFLVCDHFEPRHGVSNDRQAFERLDAWHAGYSRLQERCMEAYGTKPLHSFFYPPHHGIEHLARLSDMVFDGLGEVELHYHHDGDDEASFRRAFGEVIDEYKRWGFLLEAGEKPNTSFGFIHGDWALNNSCHGKFCGVNDELTVLKEFGCWGDLTMPSGNVCQTKKINSLYYAESSPVAPKGHDRGIDARVGATDTPGLLMMQGPLGINWGAPDHPRIENSSLTTRNWGRPDRIRKWLDCDIHVQGRPDWQFVKLHSHGALERDFDGLFGEKAFEMHRVLNEQYNDGERYQLHYVTARQAYNLVKAAEHGKSGDPSLWVDYAVKQQPHSFYALDARHRLESCTSERLEIDDIESNVSTVLRLRIGRVSTIVGAIGNVAVDAREGSLRLRPRSPGESLELTLEKGSRVVAISGARLSDAATPAGAQRLTFVDDECLIRVGANAYAAA